MHIAVFDTNTGASKFARHQQSETEKFQSLPAPVAPC